MWIKMVKNKEVLPFKVMAFDTMYGEGISKEGSLLNVGIIDDHGVVQKPGAWVAYGDERLGQGRENAKLLLKENNGVREHIRPDIYEKLGLEHSREETLEKSTAEYEST
jgi:recombination protein RecA